MDNEMKRSSRKACVQYVDGMDAALSGTIPDATGFSGCTTSNDPVVQLLAQLDVIEVKIDDLQYAVEQLAEKLAELDVPYNSGYSLDD